MTTSTDPPSAAFARILYVTSRFPVLSETFVFREVEALRALGATVEVATLRPAPDDPATRTLADRLGRTVSVYGAGFVALVADAVIEMVTHPCATARVLVTAARDFFAARDLVMRGRLVLPGQVLAAMALARRARPLDVGHLHGHMANAPTTIAMYAAMQLGATFSFTGHANDLFANRSLLAEKLRRASFVACISEWHRAFYRSVAHVEDERLPIVRCGVEIPAPRTATTSDAPIRVVGVGRLVPTKGFHALVSAVRLLQQRGTAIEVTIVGDGPERRSLEALRSELRRPAELRLAGAAPHADVLDLVRGADLFTLPCTIDAAGDRDGIPVALMEAMAGGVPVISGDLPAVRELVRHGETGLLVSGEDAVALADSIQRLAAHPEERARLGRSGRAWVEAEFSTDLNIARLIAAFRAVARSRKVVNEPGIAVLLVTCMAAESTCPALASLRPHFETGLLLATVADHSSQDGSLARDPCDGQPATIVEGDGNIGNGRECNVGLGSPETEKFVDRLRHRMPRAGLKWLHRLSREPRRLAQRFRR